MLSCSQELVIRNPEYYTVWNERKRALKLSPPPTKDSITKELTVNVLAIRANPKSYGAWFHRRWFIENHCEEMKEVVVEDELKLLSQLLDLDCRNCKRRGWMDVMNSYLFNISCSSRLELSSLADWLGRSFSYR